MSVPVLERYVTAGELAQLMGVSVSTVKRMVVAGMPSETWGLSRTRRYLPSQAMAWAAARGRMPLPTGPASARTPPGSNR